MASRQRPGLRGRGAGRLGSARSTGPPGPVQLFRPRQGGGRGAGRPETLPPPHTARWRHRGCPRFPNGVHGRLGLRALDAARPSARCLGRPYGRRITDRPSSRGIGRGEHRADRGGSYHRQHGLRARRASAPSGPRPLSVRAWTWLDGGLREGRLQRTPRSPTGTGQGRRGLGARRLRHRGQRAGRAGPRLSRWQARGGIRHRCDLVARHQAQYRTSAPAPPVGCRSARPAPGRGLRFARTAVS
jgi:hypothetical protein